jgi:hypothetical protein
MFRMEISLPSMGSETRSHKALLGLLSDMEIETIASQRPKIWVRLTTPNFIHEEMGRRASPGIARRPSIQNRLNYKTQT